MTAVDTLPARRGRHGRPRPGWSSPGSRPASGPTAMFAEDVFTDLSLPHWRLQARAPTRAFHLREDDHPQLGEVRVEALDRTSRGFLLQFEERWEAEGQQWYCRELIHCVVTDGWISELVVYCTGDWDEAVQRRHAEQVRLIRP